MFVGVKEVGTQVREYGGVETAIFWADFLTKARYGVKGEKCLDLESETLAVP